MNKARCLWAFAGLLFLSLIPAFSQQTGEIRGVVTDDAKSPLPGVAITAKSPNLQGLRGAVSDKSGAFRLPLLPVGLYDLTFELQGFEKLTLAGHSARLGFTSSISVVLKASVVLEEVTVTAPNPLIDKTRGDNSYRLNGDELARVPSQQRTIAEVVSFTPGVTGVRANTVSGGSAWWDSTETGLPSFRGQGDFGNNWLIDGLTVNSPKLNSPEIDINYDAWEEVQIISDGVAPELGQAMGGYINVITKSGGNTFHGELGGLIRDRRLRAGRQDQLSVANLPESSRSHFFGNLGGPILKDKLWFFVSDSIRRSLDLTEERSVSWLTIPAGERSINTNNLFGKITFSPWANHTFSFGANWDTLINQKGGIGVPETYMKTDYGDYSFRVNYRGILSRNTLLTAVWGQYKADEGGVPLNGDYGPPSYFWEDIGQITNNMDQAWKTVLWRSDYSLALSRYADFGRWGNHEFGAGFSYYKNTYDLEVMLPGRDADPWPGNGFDHGMSIDWSSPENPSMLYEYSSFPSHDATQGIGFYIQDNIQVGRFAFMLGLRADSQRITNDVGELVWKWGLADFLSPRASLSVDLLADGKNILKFSFGRFAIPNGQATLWRFNRRSPLGIRFYNWVGETGPTDDQLIDPSNWEFVFEESAEATPMGVDPELKPNKTTKFLLEFDRQLGRDWAFKVRGIFSDSRNLTEDVAFYDPDLAVSNPDSLGVGYIYTNFSLKRRDYRALEIEVNGRIRSKFMLDASYTWSRAKGTSSGNCREFSVWNSSWLGSYETSQFGNRPYVPEGEPNKELIDSLFTGLGGEGVGDEGWYGYLPYSVDHVIKILGTYLAPRGFAISAGIEYLSGYHWEKKGLVLSRGAYDAFPEGRGVRKTPGHMYMDLSLEKDIRLKGGMTLALGLNMYNLLNSQRPVSYLQSDNELFGQVWARQLPRWVQLKATFRF